MAFCPGELKEALEGRAGGTGWGRDRGRDGQKVGVGLHAAQNTKHRVVKSEPPFWSQSTHTKLSSDGSAASCLWAHLAASLQGQHTPAMALEYPVLSVTALLSMQQ